MCSRFVYLSSFYLCNIQKRKSIKTVELFIQVIVFRLAIYLGGIIIKGEVISAKSLVPSFSGKLFFSSLFCFVYFIPVFEFNN